MIIIYTTVKDQAEAENIATLLLSEKLVACATFYPTKSMYLWQSKIEASEEYILLLKTKPENSEKVTQKIQQVHSYEIPCILTFKAGSTRAYAEWLKQELGSVRI